MSEVWRKNIVKRKRRQLILSSNVWKRGWTLGQLYLKTYQMLAFSVADLFRLQPGGNQVWIQSRLLMLVFVLWRNHLIVSALRWMWNNPHTWRIICSVVTYHQVSSQMTLTLSQTLLKVTHCLIWTCTTSSSTPVYIVVTVTKAGTTEGCIVKSVLMLTLLVMK